jgi:hypothetical protein
VISHRYKCVYVHIPKSGGQSIESVFVEQHGLTWATRAPLLLRPCSDRRFGPKFLAHLTAAEYVSLGHLSPTDWQDYFTFAAIRNPWDRMLSTYRYLDPEGVSFAEWLTTTAQKRLERGHFFFLPQADYVCDSDGQIIVDMIIRLEDFPSAFDVVRDRLQISGSGLTRVNVSEQHTNLTLDAAYDEATENVVAEMYARDIELWDYQPPSAQHG